MFWVYAFLLLAFLGVSMKGGRNWVYGSLAMALGVGVVLFVGYLL